jgi:hypothetical protein
MAIWAVVLAGLGVIGLCCLGVGGIILGGVAFFLGGSAMTRIRSANGSVGGMTLAQVGRWGGLAVAIIGVLVLLAYIVAVVNSGSATPSSG